MQITATSHPSADFEAVFSPEEMGTLRALAVENIGQELDAGVAITDLRPSGPYLLKRDDHHPVPFYRLGATGLAGKLSAFADRTDEKVEELALFLPSALLKATAKERIMDGKRARDMAQKFMEHEASLCIPTTEAAANEIIAQETRSFDDWLDSLSD